MSGPIVRRYGFPNFEKIFGERELKHGVEDETPAAENPDPSPEVPKPSTDPGAQKPGTAPTKP